jgi:hypothetical protein
MILKEWSSLRSRTSSTEPLRRLLELGLGPAARVAHRDEDEDREHQPAQGDHRDDPADDLVPVGREDHGDEEREDEDGQPERADADARARRGRVLGAD